MVGMTLGRTPVQGGLWWGSAGLVADRVGPDSIWALLHEHGAVLFPDELFEDLFSSRGRRSVPPQVVATVMVLQRLFGKSDREAVEAFEFDVRWKYAAGGLDVDYRGCRAHGAGGHAGEAGPFGSASPTVRSGPGSGETERDGRDASGVGFHAVV